MVHFFVFFVFFLFYTCHENPLEMFPYGLPPLPGKIQSLWGGGVGMSIFWNFKYFALISAKLKVHSYQKFG